MYNAIYLVVMTSGSKRENDMWWEGEKEGDRTQRGVTPELTRLTTTGQLNIQHHPIFEIRLYGVVELLVYDWTGKTGLPHHAASSSYRSP